MIGIRRISRVLLIVTALVAGAGVSAVAVTQTRWFRNWLRDYVVREVNQSLNGHLSVGRLNGNLFFSAELASVELTMDDRPVAAVKAVALEYNVFELLFKQISIRAIRIEQPRISLWRQGQTWAVVQLLIPDVPAANGSEPGQPVDSQSAKPIAVREIDVRDGSLTIDGPLGINGVDVPHEIDHVNATLSLEYAPFRYAIDIANLSFRGSRPAFHLAALSGDLSGHDDNLYVRDLALRTDETSLSVHAAVEHFATTPTFSGRIDADPFSLPEISRLVPALTGIPLRPAFDLTVDGPLAHLRAATHVRSSAGALDGQVQARLATPEQEVEGAVVVRHLNLAPIVRNPNDTSDLTATVNVDLRSASFTDLDALRGRISLEASTLAAAGYVAERVRATATLSGPTIMFQGRADAYGAAVTTEGTLTWPHGHEALSYDARGDLSGLDLARLPRTLTLPSVRTTLNLDRYHLSGSGAATVKGEALLASSELAGARISQGAILDISKHGDLIGFSTDVTVASLDLQQVGKGFGLAVLASPGYHTDLNGHIAASGTLVGTVVSAIDGQARFDGSELMGAPIVPGTAVSLKKAGTTLQVAADASVEGIDLQQLGRTFGMPALASERYHTDLNAHVVATATDAQALRALNANVHGEFTHSCVLGARVPMLAFEASMGGDTAHLTASGAFADLNPAALGGPPQTTGHMAGSLAVDVSLEQVSAGLTRANFGGTLQLSLEPSAIGPLQIKDAHADLAYHQQVLTIHTLTLAGQDLRAQISGTVALDRAGASNVTLHAESSDLSSFGLLVNQPLSGMGTLDATVTGNGSQLTATGAVVADDLSYRENGALTMSTDYTIHVPDLSITAASVAARAHATFVTVAGQHINSVTATANYGDRRLDVDVIANQPSRSLMASGGLWFGPEPSMVELRRADLRSGPLRWQLASDARPSIRYGGGAVIVNDLRLVSGMQMLAVDGTYGTADGVLNLRASDVDLADVDALMLRPAQLSGELNASATIARSSGVPTIDADVKVDRGAFRQFHYDAFSAIVKYTGAGVTLDADLQQNPGTQLTARGYVPMTLFSPAQSAAHASSASAADRIDVRIESTPIDLGLVQGFTTTVKNVHGTLQANVRVMGSSADPRPSGTLTVQNGAFTVVPTGVAYSGLDAQIELQADRIHVAALQLLDSDKKTLSVTGDIPFTAARLGDVDIAVAARDFSVMHGKMGTARINSTLSIKGDERSPQIDGDLAIATGTLNLDPIVTAMGGSVYSTTPIGVGTSSPEGTAPAPSPDAHVPGTGLQMNVHVTVPDDLVVRSTNLQVPGSPMGLGALNVTLGADLRAIKSPGSDVRIIGRMTTVRGTYLFQGRQFTIVRGGTVRFEGLAQLDPSLDIKAQRVIDGVEADVNIRGTLEKPRIVLSSVPPLEQADILSLIVFNQSLNQMGEGQQIQIMQTAEQMAGGALAGRFAKSLGGALNLSELNIQTAPLSGAAVQVTVGQQIAQNLYARLEQGAGNDVSTTNFILEYDLTTWLRLKTNVLQGGSNLQQALFQTTQDSGFDLTVFFSF